jgi:uncharacterized protein (TIGR00251 family)
MGAMATLNVKVVPGASRDRVVGRYGDGIKVQVSAPPEGGKANKALIEVIAAALGVRAQQVQIVKGQAQARKVIEVSGMELGDVLDLLGGRSRDGPHV